MKILIADSNEETRSTAEECLKKFGVYDITKCGKAAFELLRTSLVSREPYDIVISNTDMPEVNGISLLRLIRTYEEAFEVRKKTKFVLVSESHKNRSWLGKDRSTVIIEPYSKKALFKEILRFNILEKNR